MHRDCLCMQSFGERSKKEITFNQVQDAAQFFTVSVVGGSMTATPALPACFQEHPEFLSPHTHRVQECLRHIKASSVCVGALPLSFLVLKNSWRVLPKATGV